MHQRFFLKFTQPSPRLKQGGLGKVLGEISLLVGWLFLTISILSGQSNITLTLGEESVLLDQLVVCGAVDEQTVLFSLQGDATSSRTNIQATLNLFPNIEFVNFDASKSSTGVSLAGNTGSQVDFNLPDLAPDGTTQIAITFTVQTNCQILDTINTDGLQVFDTWQVDYEMDGNTLFENFNGTEYKDAIAIPNLNIFLDKIEGAYRVGTEIKRNLTISNSGLNSYLSAFDYEVIAESGLSYQNVLVNNIPIDLEKSANGEGDTIFKASISDTYFGDNVQELGQLSNGDNLFDVDEELTIEETILITSCGRDGNANLNTLHQVNWGCTEEICRTESQSSNIGIGVGEELIEYSYNSDATINASSCDEGTVSITIANNGFEFDDGFGAITDIAAGIGFATGADFLAADEGFEIESITIGNSTIVNLPTGLINLHQNVEFSTDPDGPGGLEDFDGDGFFDDLRVGASFTISATFNTSCANGNQFDIENECDNDFRGNFDGKIEYTNACGNNNESLFDNFYRSSNSGSTIEVCSDTDAFNDNSQFTVNYAGERRMSNFNRSCTGNDEIRVNLTLPQGIGLSNQTILEQDNNQFTPTIQTTESEVVMAFAATDFNLNNDYQFNFVFETQCASVGPTSFPVEISCFCPECNCSHIWYCGVLEGAILHASGAPCAEFICDSGLQITNFEVERTTFGFTDADFLNPFNPSEANKKVALSCDSVVMKMTTIVGNQTLTDSIGLEVNYGNADGNDSQIESFLFNFAEVTIQSGGNTRTCTIDTNAYRLEILGNNKTMFFELGGCLNGISLNMGDQIEFRGHFMVNADGPIPTNTFKKIPELRAKGYAIIDGIFQDNCDSYGELFRLAKLTTSFSGPNNSTYPTSCEPTSLVYTISKSINANAMREFMGEEHRQAVMVDSLQFNYDANILSAFSDLSVDYRIQGSEWQALPNLQEASAGRYHAGFSMLNTASTITGSNQVFQYRINLIPDCSSNFGSSLGNNNYEIESQINYNNRFFAEQTGCEEIIEDSDKRQFTYQDPPTFSLEAVIGDVQSAEETIQWTVEHCNTSFTAAAGISFVELEKMEGDLEILFIENISNENEIDTLMLRQFGTNNDVFAFTDGLINKSTNATQDSICNTLRITARLNNCTAVSLAARAGWNCSTYDDPNWTPESYAPCQEESILLKAAPLTPLLSASFQERESEISGTLCDTSTMVILVRNEETGNAYDIQSQIILPAGATLVAGSIEFAYPANTPLTPILQDPTFIGNTELGQVYQYDDFQPLNTFLAQNGLPGFSINATDSSEFRLKYRFITNCDYENGELNRYSFQGLSACGEATNNAFAETNPIIFQADPNIARAFQINFSLEKALPVGGNATISLSVENISPNLSAEDKIEIVLPAELSYVANSVQVTSPNNWTPEEPTIKNNAGSKVLNLLLPTGLGQNESAEFQFEVSVGALDCDSTYVSKVATTSSTAFTCVINNESCVYDFNSSIEAEFPLAIECNPGNCTISGNDSITLYAPNCDTAIYYCFNQYTPQDILGYTITADGVELDTNDFRICNYEQVCIYTYAQISTFLGVMEITNWTVDGEMFTANVNSIQELVDSMNVWDDGGNWAIVPEALIIQGGHIGKNYSQMEITFPRSGIRAFLGYDTRLSPQGLAILLQAGLHEVIIVDPNDCRDTLQVEIIPQECLECQAPKVENIIVENANCNESNGTVHIQIAGNPADYNFNWSPNVGEGQESRMNLPMASYLVQVVDKFNPDCFETLFINVGNADGPKVSFEKTNTECDSTTGSINLSPDNFTYNWNDGRTGASRTGLAEGRYIITVSDPNNPTCENLVTINIDAISNLTINHTVFRRPNCRNQNGVVAFDVSGGSGQYQTSFPDGALAQVNLGSGSYEIIVIDEITGCEQTYFFVLNDAVHQGAISIVETNNLACVGDTTGRINFEVNYENGFRFPADTMITDGLRTYENGALPAGEYQIVIQDVNGCVGGSVNFEITEPPAPKAEISKIGACSEGRTIEVSFSGGSLPYFYDWADVEGIQNQKDRTDLNAGNYNLNIIDGNDCSTPVSIELPICDCVPASGLVAIIENADCGQSNGQVAMDLDQAVDQYTFRYEPNLGIEGANKNIRNQLPIGSYMVTLTSIGDTSCVSTIEVEVLEKELTEDIVEAVIFPSNCANPPTGTVVLTPSEFTYTWPDGFVGNNRNQLTSGSYEVSFTDPNAGPQCVGVKIIEITTVNNITITPFILKAPTCGLDNGSVGLEVLGGSGNYSYSWVVNSPTNTALASGSYEVTVFDATTGCQAITNFELEALPQGIATLSIIDTINVSCRGGMNGGVNFTVEYSADFQFPADTIITNGFNTFENGTLPVGEYCIQILDANACLNGEGCFFVEEFDSLSLMFEPIAACADTGGINLEVLGGAAPFVFNWADLEGIDNQMNRSNLDTGLYEVTVTDANGCVELASIQVPECDACIPPEIIEISTTPTNCSGNTGSIFIRMEEEERNYDFFYSPDVGQPFVTGNIRASMPKGIYTILIVYKANPSCMVEVEVEVKEKDFSDLLPITSPADCGLANGRALLELTTNIYTWPDGFVGNTREDLEAGFYEVLVRDEFFECDTMITVVVNENNLLQTKVTIDNTPTCGNADGAVTLNVTGGSDDYSYSWEGGAPSRANLSSGTYSLLITDNRTGCKSPFVFTLVDGPSTLIAIEIEEVFDANCPLEADGLVDFSVNNLENFPNTIFDTLITNGGTNFENGSLPQGDYCLSIIDTMGCTYGQACFTIDAPEFLETTIEVIPECESGGSINVQVVGGVGPYIFDWEDAEGFDDQPFRTDLEADLYHLTITDRNGCTLILDSLTVDVCEPCALQVGRDTLYYNLDDCSVTQEICLDYDFDVKNPFNATLNGGSIDLFDINACQTDTIESYAVATLFGEGRIGPYSVTSWPVNDQNFTGEFTSLAELVAAMNEWDPNGNWQFTEDGTQIIGGASNTTYGQINAVVQGTPITSFLEHETRIFKRGISTRLGHGIHIITVQDPKTFCEDTLTVVMSCVELDTIKLVTNPTVMDTFCMSTEQLVGGEFTLNIDCLNQGLVGTSIIQDTCLVIEGIAVGADTICVSLCDEYGVCDTTIFEIDVHFDIIHDTLPIDSMNMVCLDSTMIAIEGSIISMQKICPDTTSNLADFEFDVEEGCVTYIANTIGEETTCIEICDDLGLCDTIEFTLTIRNNPPDDIVDTIFVGETIEYCFDSLIFPGQIRFFENICPDSSGEKVDFFLDPITFCVEYSGVKVGREKACIVVCDEQNICDTAFFDIEVIEFLGLPDAVDDVDTTDKGVPIPISVLENDIPFGVDIEKGLSIVEEPPTGIAPVNLDGSITFLEEEFCERVVEFTYQLCNSVGCDTASVKVYIRCIDIEVFTAMSPNRDGYNDNFFISRIEEFPNSKLTILNRWGNVVYQTINYQNDWEGTWKNNQDLPDGTYFYILELNEPNDNRVFQGFIELHR